MSTRFALMLERCGLSQREAALFLAVRPDTVRSWSAGRNRVPAGVVEALRALHAEIEAVSRALPPADLPLTDAEARRFGLPAAGALGAALGLAAVRAPAGT